MDTKEKKKQPKRPSQSRKKGTPSLFGRPAFGKRTAGTAKPNSDRARREQAARAAKLKAMRQSVEHKPRRSVSKPIRPMQPVVYTQPKVFNRNRLLIQLVSMMAVVLSLVMCLSIFFRVKTVTVSGNNAYSAWAIREASGIEDGDYLMTFSKARACAKIEAALPYVYSARIGIKLPDTVNIVIEEIDVVYAIADNEGIWWLMTSEGVIMEQSNAGEASEYTKIQGVTIVDPVIDDKAVAFQAAPVGNPESETDVPTEETESAVPLLVTEQQKLNAALEILQSLELNEIVGEAASVDVSDLGRIELWYGTRYKVNLGDTGDMDYKISCLKATVNTLSDYDSGELDVSFIQWPDKVAYTPFE